MGNVVAALLVIGLITIFAVALVRDIRHGLWARSRSRGANYTSSDPSSPGSFWSSGSWTGDSCATGADGGSCGGDGGGGGGD